MWWPSILDSPFARLSLNDLFDVFIEGLELLDACEEAGTLLMSRKDRPCPTAKLQHQYLVPVAISEKAEIVDMHYWGH